MARYSRPVPLNFGNFFYRFYHTDDEKSYFRGDSLTIALPLVEQIFLFHSDDIGISILLQQTVGCLCKIRLMEEVKEDNIDLFRFKDGNNHR